jgi:hypothetical protein
LFFGDLFGGVFEVTEKQRKNFGEFGQSSLHGAKNVV